MTTLSELEEQARGLAFNAFADTKQTYRVTVWEVRAFNAGFQAGLTYSQKRIEELELKLSAIMMAQSMGTPSFVGLPVGDAKQARIEELEAMLGVAALQAYSEEVVNSGMESYIIGVFGSKHSEFASKEEWIKAKIEEWLKEVKEGIR